MKKVISLACLLMVFIFQSFGQNVTPVITHTSLSPQIAGSAIVVQASITDDKGVTSAILNYRRGGDADFAFILMAKNETTYQAIIPSTFVGSRGLEYFIVAMDVDGNTTRAPFLGIFSVQVIIPDPGEIKVNAQPAGSATSAFRLISVPLNLGNNSPRDVLEDDLGAYDGTKWRFFEARANQIFVEFPNTSPMIPGKAFWLIVKDAGKVIDTGGGISNSTSREFSIPLHPAWNLIANPFNFSIPVSKIRLESGGRIVLFSYQGTWTLDTSTIQPFEGYAVFNSSSVDTLFINPNLSTIAVSNGESNDLWSIRIMAQSQGARDVDNVAAIVSEASRSWDEKDQPEPPFIGEYVSVYFPHPEWGKLSKIYCTDFRPEFSDGEIWHFEVTTNIRDKVELTFEGLKKIPSEFEVWLVDEALQVSQNLRNINHYAVTGTDYPKQLRLVVGNQDFISTQLTTEQFVPGLYELSQNFPNPFNPATTIRYGLPRDEMVSLKVYNFLGEEVITLVENKLQKAGYHVAIWDGRNNKGNIVASGMYFIRMSAGNFNQTRKMLFIE